MPPFCSFYPYYTEVSDDCCCRLSGTKVVERVVRENDIFPWMRLLAFRHIVLNKKSKGEVTLNVIRPNLDVWMSMIFLRGLLLGEYIFLETRKFISREDLVIKIALLKVCEGDIKGAIRVFCSDELFAPS